MKNIPRIFVGNNVKSGDILPASRDVAHYLGRVMRTRDFIAFGGGHEFGAYLDENGKTLHIANDTGRADPTGDVTLYFAPIKKTDDLINMVTQMGVRRIVPVITARTVAHNINWDRMRRIAVEASEQSNRNSVPEIAPAIRFADLPFDEIVFGDERAAHTGDRLPCVIDGAKSILVGPEGGFADSEFDMLDRGGARGISLGKTVLRAELAAAIAVSRIMECK